MQSTPKAPGAEKRDAKLGPVQEKTRMQVLEENGLPIQLPDVSHGYLVGYLFEVGPAMASGMGAVPLTHTEIAAWEGHTSIALTPWEARTLRSLSIAYLNEQHRSDDIHAISPYEEHDIDQAEAHAKRMAASLRDSIRNMTQ